MEFELKLRILENANQLIYLVLQLGESGWKFIE